MTLRGASTRKQLASAQSRLCIEGFPRSGNSFSLTCALEIPGLEAGQVADHTHSSANVRRAVARGLPTFVVIRDPLEASLSLSVMGHITSIDDGLEAWLGFHRRIQPVMDRVVIVPLEVLGAEPYGFVQAVADAVGLAPPPPRPDFAAYMVERRRELDRAWGMPPTHGSIPDASRDRAKKAMLGQVASGRAERLLKPARDAYDRILSSAPKILRPIALPIKLDRRDGSRQAAA
ncbi:MAG: hypothetical protein JWM33_237 [Caulobacteraceae bacterium]|nr:hypothetical protein [Caulobacteraceae bacterium]